MSVSKTRPRTGCVHGFDHDLCDLPAVLLASLFPARRQSLFCPGQSAASLRSLAGPWFRCLSSDADDLSLTTFRIFQEDAERGFRISALLIQLPVFHCDVETHGPVEHLGAVLAKTLCQLAHVLIHFRIHADLIPALFCIHWCNSENSTLSLSPQITGNWRLEKQGLLSSLQTHGLLRSEVFVSGCKPCPTGASC